MKYKVKLRYQIGNNLSEKISFHLEEGSKFVLGKNSPGFKFDQINISEKQCTLSVEAGQMYATHEGGDIPTLLNHQKMRSRPVHVGDILEFSECVIEFLEVPFIQKTAENAQTMFIDLSQGNTKPTHSMEFDREKSEPSKKIQTKSSPQVQGGTSEGANSNGEFENLTKHQRKKKLKELKRQQEIQQLKELSGKHSSKSTSDEDESETESKDSSAAFESKAYAPELPSKKLEKFENFEKNFHEQATLIKPLSELEKLETQKQVQESSDSVKRLPSTARPQRMAASELARKQAEELRKTLDSIPAKGDGITDLLQLTSLRQKVKASKFANSYSLQIGVGASIPICLMALYFLFKTPSRHEDDNNRSISSTPEVVEQNPFPPSDIPSAPSLVQTPTQAPQQQAQVQQPVAVTQPQAQGVQQPISQNAQKVIEREQAFKPFPAPLTATQSTVVTPKKPEPNRNQISELVEAANLGDSRTVQNLIFEEGVDPNSRTVFGETALLAAASRGQLSIVKLLIDKGVQVNDADSDGNTPLMRAVTGGHLKVVQFLVLNGASTRLRNRKGDTALRLATRWNKKEIINFLQGSGSDPANRKRLPANKKSK